MKVHVVQFEQCTFYQDSDLQLLGEQWKSMIEVRSLVIRIVPVWEKKDSVPCLSADSTVMMKNKHNAVVNSKLAFFGLCQYCIQWAVRMAR